MKFMKLGIKEDAFVGEGAIRTVGLDVPPDLFIKIKNSTYLLHKHIMLPKCGLLQRSYADSADSNSNSLEIHDIPGGTSSFDICTKFCYAFQISISAYNFLSLYSAAKFLEMTESIHPGNFAIKLEVFFKSCIIQGWKDSIITLQTSRKFPDWSERLGLIRRCVDSIVEKIITPPEKISWSFTYTRPGYEIKEHHSAPKDWWTEDISDLDVDTFRCLLTAVKLANTLPLQLIGEALHVYAARWLPKRKDSELLEKIVGMIPPDAGSVSVSFLLRLLRTANFVKASVITKAELVRRSSQQLEEAVVGDLLFPSPSKENLYDIDSVFELLECCLRIRKKRVSSVQKIGKLIDAYLQVVAEDPALPLSKFMALVKALPDVARPSHDDLYKAINTYLKDHPHVSKGERKRLCWVLDCRKLSPAVCAHVVRNERLPLRTVVQVLFFDQERGQAKLLDIADASQDAGRVRALAERRHASMEETINRG